MREVRMDFAYLLVLALIAVFPALESEGGRERYALQADTQAERATSATSRMDIERATTDAEFILVGKSPIPTYRRNILGERSPRPSGYNIEAIDFLKGAGHHSRHDGTEFISIRFLEMSVEDRKSSLVLPEPNDPNATFIYFLNAKRAAFSSSPRSLPLSPEEWLIPATESNIRTVREHLPAPTKWGKAADGLKIGLLTRKPSYKLGDSIDIEIYVQNVSDKEIVVPQHRLKNTDNYPFTSFHGATGIRVSADGSVSSGKGLRVFFEKPVGMEEHNKRLSPPVRLQPGHSYCERIRLNSWQWTTLDGNSPFRSGITLKLMAWFNTEGLEDNSGFWRGRVDSAYIDVTFD